MSPTTRYTSFKRFNVPFSRLSIYIWFTCRILCVSKVMVSGNQKYAGTCWAHHLRLYLPEVKKVFWEFGLFFYLWHYQISILEKGKLGIESYFVLAVYICWLIHEYRHFFNRHSEIRWFNPLISWSNKYVLTNLILFYFVATEAYRW